MSKSVKLAIWLLCLAALAILVWFALSNLMLGSSGIDPPLKENIWRSAGLQIVLPITANILLIAILTWLTFRSSGGKEQVRTGPKILFLKPREFWVRAIFCLALLSPFLWLTINIPDSPFRWVAYGSTGLFAYILAWLLRARVTYDEHAISVLDWTLREKEYRWSDLVRIDHVTESLEYHFIFEPGGRARVSQVFSGVEDLLTVALRQSNLMIPPDLRARS